MYASRRTEHVTPLLRDLHWLRYPDQIDYKLAVLVYRCLHGWRRAISPTNSRVCRRLSRDGIFGRLRRPVLSCLAFSGRHSAVVHSLWQRLKHGTAYRHMSHHLHRWRLSSAASRLSCSRDHTLKPDIGWCSTSLFWLCYMPSKSTLIYVTLIIFVINIIYLLVSSTWRMSNPTVLAHLVEVCVQAVQGLPGFPEMATTWCRVLEICN